MKPAQTISRTVSRTSPPGGGEPHLFLTLRCDRPIEPGARFYLHDANVVTIGRGESLSMERREEDGVAVMRIGTPDPRMSSTQARLQSVLESWMIQDAGSKNGTWLDGRRVTSAPLRDGALLELGHSFLLYREALPAAGPELLDARELRPAAPGLATLSPRLAADLGHLELVARSRVSILIRGETGTGKEVIASAIHQLSGRPGRFIAVNCGALPESLVESELFGSRKRGVFGRDGGPTRPRAQQRERDAAARRDRRPAAPRAGSAPPRAPGRGSSRGRRHASRQGRSPGGRLHSPRPGRAGRRGALPLRSAGPPLGLQSLAAAVAGKARGPGAPHRRAPAQAGRRRGERRAVRARGGARVAASSVAAERPRAGEVPFRSHRACARRRGRARAPAGQRPQWAGRYGSDDTRSSTALEAGRRAQPARPPGHAAARQRRQRHRGRARDGQAADAGAAMAAAAGHRPTLV